MYSLTGLDMLLLSTTGRRTGYSRYTPLLYIHDSGQYYSVASFGGNASHPKWFLNLVDDPKVHLLVRRKRINAVAQVISGQERSRVWENLVNCYPSFAKYQERTDRTIPVIKFSPVTDTGENSKT